VLCYEPRNSAVGVIQVSKYPHLGGTRGYTGGLASLPNQVDAKPALDGNALVVVKGTHLIGAGFYAVLAADASVAMDQHHPFRRGVDRARRANPLTRTVFTLVALQGNELLAKGRVYSTLLFLDPVEGLAIFQGLLILAGNAARVTPDAFGCIYCDSIARHVHLPQGSMWAGKVRLFSLLLPQLGPWKQLAPCVHWEST
jgi:hypothetical protein